MFTGLDNKSSICFPGSTLFSIKYETCDSIVSPFFANTKTCNPKKDIPKTIQHIKKIHCDLSIFRSFGIIKK